MKCKNIHYSLDDEECDGIPQFLVQSIKRQEDHVGTDHLLISTCQRVR
jgi:hypothetical protein